MSDQDDERLDDDLDRDKDPLAAEPRRLSSELSESLRAAMRPQSEALAATLAAAMPRTYFPPPLLPASVRSFLGVQPSLLQQQTNMIAKIVAPNTDLVKRLGLAHSALMPTMPSVLQQHVDMIAKFTKPQIPLWQNKFDFTAMLPQFNITALLPKYDFAAAAFGALDVTSFLPRLGFPGFSDLLESLRRDEPPNWVGVDYDLDVVAAIIRDDGIPLVWVPRAEIVEELLEAEDREARVAVLLSRVDDLVEDCRGVLEDIDDETLAGQKPLAVNAVDSLADGHFQAAQALAVAVTETAVARSLGSRYVKVKSQVLFDPDLVPWTQLRLRAALGPIYPFYTAWRPSDGVPAPKTLSRHVSVHQADTEHYSRGNAVIAVLLVVSVLRALQELQAIAAASTADDEEVA